MMTMMIRSDQWRPSSGFGLEVNSMSSRWLTTSQNRSSVIITMMVMLMMFFSKKNIFQWNSKSYFFVSGTKSRERAAPTTHSSEDHLNHYHDHNHLNHLNHHHDHYHLNRHHNNQRIIIIVVMIIIVIIFITSIICYYIHHHHCHDHCINNTQLLGSS